MKFPEFLAKLSKLDIKNDNAVGKFISNDLNSLLEEFERIQHTGKVNPKGEDHRRLPIRYSSGNSEILRKMLEIEVVSDAELEKIKQLLEKIDDEDIQKSLIELLEVAMTDEQFTQVDLLAGLDDAERKQKIHLKKRSINFSAPDEIANSKKKLATLEVLKHEIENKKIFSSGEERGLFKVFVQANTNKIYEENLASMGDAANQNGKILFKKLWDAFNDRLSEARKFLSDNTSLNNFQKGKQGETYSSLAKDIFIKKFLIGGNINAKELLDKLEKEASAKVDFHEKMDVIMRRIKVNEQLADPVFDEIHKRLFFYMTWDRKKKMLPFSDIIQLWFFDDIKIDTEERQINKEIKRIFSEMGIENIPSHKVNSEIIVESFEKYADKMEKRADEIKAVLANDKPELDRVWKSLSISMDRIGRSPVFFINTLLSLREAIGDALQKELGSINERDLRYALDYFIRDVKKNELTEEQARILTPIAERSGKSFNPQKELTSEITLENQKRGVNLEDTFKVMHKAVSDFVFASKYPEGKQHMNYASESIHSSYLSDYFSTGNTVHYTAWKQESKLPWWKFRTKYTRNIDKALKDYSKLHQKSQDHPERLLIKLYQIKSAADLYLKENKRGSRTEAVNNLLELVKGDIDTINAKMDEKIIQWYAEKAIKRGNEPIDKTDKANKAHKGFGAVIEDLNKRIKKLSEPKSFLPIKSAVHKSNSDNERIEILEQLVSNVKAAVDKIKTAFAKIDAHTETENSSLIIQLQVKAERYFVDAEKEVAKLGYSTHFLKQEEKKFLEAIDLLQKHHDDAKVHHEGFKVNKVSA